MTRQTRRRNRIVKPFRGDLYNMVVKNYAYVAIPDAFGRPAKDKGGKIIRSRRKEVVDTFSIYYNLCLADEYFKLLYEKQLQGEKVKATLQQDFSSCWKYLLRRFASKAPKGMREVALKVERRLESADKAINEGLTLLSAKMDLNLVTVNLKKATSSIEFKKLVEDYAKFLKKTFSMLGMNVIAEEKNNPKFNIRYTQFSVGNEISEIISQSSPIISAKVEKAAKLKKLRDAKLKSSLLKEGFHVETQPYYVKDKGMAYLTVAYDARVTQIPKPRSKPTPPSFKDKEYDLILNLDNIVKGRTLFPTGVDPKDLFTAPNCSIKYSSNGKPSLVYEAGEKERNERIIQLLKVVREEANSLSVPEFKEGFGLKPDGEPEAGYYEKGILKGKPVFRYKVPKSKCKKYAQAVKVLTKVLQFRTQCENLSNHSKEVYAYKQTLKPFIKGVYSSEFTDDLGTSYIRFDDMKKLAKKVIKKRDARMNKKLSEPTISSQSMVLDDYPMLRGNQIVYGKRRVQIAEFKYSNNMVYNPIHYKDLLKEALQRIRLGKSRDSLTTEQEKRILVPKFREIKGEAGITKTFQLCTLKDESGKEIEIIVSGRYAGYELDAILNMEGRFFEGGYYTKNSQTGENRKVYLPRMLFDAEGNVSTTEEVQTSEDTWEYKQRLVEPYISFNPVTKQLVLGIPGSNMGTADKKIMRSLARSISTINEKRDPRIKSEKVQSLNPFFTFEPEDFETIRESLGSVAMSASATEYIDQYYESLRAKENAITVENTERFTPESLGGFVSETARGPFMFNNKQREAAAWLEASNMRGVIALDTGVGKTLTALMAIKNAINEEMQQGGAERRFLYVSPKSLVGNLKGEVKAFMVEGGEEFIRLDKKKEKVPNWRKIVLSRIDEISYEDFVSRFKGIENIEGELLALEEGPKLTSDAKRLNREIKYNGQVATITYEIGYKDGKEVYKYEIDFEEGNTLDTDSRTASTKPKANDIRISKELITYPSLNASQEKAKKKELSETRKSINAHKKEITIKQFPVVNEYFQNKYHACFFDEINEIFSGKGKASKNYAVSSLSHPRKVFLTASALDRDPIDLFRLATLAKGAVPTKRSEKAFAEKYGNVIGGRMVGIKPNKEVRTQFYNWVKENAYFSPKMDISVDERFGVDYKEVGLPSLQELYSRTITTQMSPSIEQEYRTEAKKITNELRAMLSKYRDLKDKLSDLTVENGDLFDSKKSKVYRDLTLATGKVKKALKELTNISAKVEGKVDVATRLFKENNKSRFLYFCTNKVLARKVAKSNSKANKSSVHALLWDNDITFYRNGKKVAGVKAKDKMSLKDFDLSVDQSIWSDIRTANEDEVDPTWAMDISKKYVKNNATLATAVCSDSYARGFNFQTFDKVVHLDRGTGFDSELLKQRTARAYRGGQAKRVEEIFIDATFTQDSETEGTISDEAKLKHDEFLVKSLERRELIRGQSYQEWIWDEDAWIKVGEAWEYPKEYEEGEYEQGDPYVVNYNLINLKVNTMFNMMGYILPADIEDETLGTVPTRRVLLKKGVDPKDLGKVSQDIDMISIDQLKSLVNKADQDFFQDIIYNGLKSDLTARIEGRETDTGIAIKTPDMLGFVLNPTMENKIRAEKQLEDYEQNPINHISYDPTRYDQSGLWLNERLKDKPIALTDHHKMCLDLIGGPSVADYLLGDAEINIRKRNEAYTVITVDADTRFTTKAQIIIRENYIINNIVKLKPCAPRGYSPKFLFSEIIVAKRLGKKYIECYAAGSTGDTTYSGYAVWPKYGFDMSINVDNILTRAKDSAYAQAIKEIYGTNPGFMSLQKFLTVTADIVTMGYDKEKLKEYKKELKEWNDRKDQEVGETPSSSRESFDDTWKVGDRLKLDTNFIQSNRPDLFGKDAVIRELAIANYVMKVEIEGTLLDQWVSSNSDVATNLSHQERQTSYEDTARTEQLAWNQKYTTFMSENPMPSKPEKEEISVDPRVAVGEKLWAIYGSSGEMKLDLRDGSVGLRIANAYLKKKAFAKNLEVQDFLNSPSDLFSIEDPWCWEQEIDKVKVRGETMDWRDVVRQYPEAMRSAWYAHQPFREKIETLCVTDSEFKKFMKKYNLVDPYTNFKTPAPKARSQQSRVFNLNKNEDTTFEPRNVSQRMKLGTQEENLLTDDEVSMRKLWEDTQDPIMLDIWEELRLENYVGRVTAEVIEDDEDVDLIEIQRLRGEK